MTEERMDVELRKNRRSGLCFMVCAENEDHIIVSCPDGIIRTLPEDFFEDPIFGEVHELVEDGTITEKQLEAFLYDKEQRDEDPMMRQLEFQIEEMTPEELDQFIKRLESSMKKKA